MKSLSRGAFLFIITLFFLLGFTFSFFLSALFVPASASDLGYTCPSGISWVCSSVNIDGSLLGSGATRIVTESLLPLSDCTISVNCPSPYQYFVYYFADESESSYIGKTSWKSGNIDDVTTDVVASGTSVGAKYCRISLRHYPTLSDDLSNRFDEFFEHISVTIVYDSVETAYTVDIDGSSFTFPTTAESITLDLIITANDYKISVDGSEEDYLISDTVLNNDKQKFAGLSVNGVVDQVDYGIGTHTITLNSSSPTLFLGTVWKYPLYVDPNGGTWNGSSSTSVFWELPNTDTDEINDPVRPGYTFSGWTFTGDGEFNDAGDPPHSYEHGTAPGYLTANWEGIPTYTHTISIDGSSYTFTAENAAPPVTIQVTSTGFTMSYGDTTKTWTYSGSDTFVGIRDSSGNTYDVGAFFSLLGLSGANKTTTIVPLTEVDPSIYYSTFIKVYDTTGNNLLTTFVARSAGSCPAATLIIADSFLCFDSSLTNQNIWDYPGEGSIAGISLTPNASSPTYTPGDTMSLGGLAGQSHVVSVYIVEVAAPEPEPTYYNTIYIDGVPYQFSGTGSSPDVQLTVQENGCFLTSGSTSLTYTYSGTGTFTGLSFVAGTDPNLPIGTVITLDGSNSGDSSIKLYACYEEVLPDQDEEFQGGVLGWLKYLSEKIRDLPADIAEKMAAASLPAPLQFIFSIFDFDSLRSFFVDMYNQVKTVFGLKTLIEDPAGPFAWLMAS